MFARPPAQASTFCSGRRTTSSIGAARSEAKARARLKSVGCPRPSRTIITARTAQTASDIGVPPRLRASLRLPFAILSPILAHFPHSERRRQNVTVFFGILKNPARSERHARQGIVGNADRQARFLPKNLIEVGEQRAATGQDDPLVHDIGREFRRSRFERNLDRLHDLACGFRERLGYVLLADGDFLGYAIQKIATLDLHGYPAPVARWRSCANLLFDALGACLADQQILVAADIGNDRLVHLVATDAN